MKTEITLFAAITIALLAVLPVAIALPTVVALAVYAFGWRAVKAVTAATIFAIGLASVAFAADAVAPAPSIDIGAILASLWDGAKSTGFVAYAVTVLVALVPKAQPGTAWGVIRGILDIVAANWGHAANAPAAPVAQPAPPVTTVPGPKA